MGAQWILLKGRAAQMPPCTSCPLLLLPFIICLTTQSSAFMVSDKTVTVSALGSGEQ